MSRLASSVLIVGLLASAAAAQEIDYDADQYKYPQAEDPSTDNDVVTQSQSETSVEGVAAERVILERHNGAAPQFVARPVIQPTAALPTIPGRIETARPSQPVVPSPGTAPVLYAYPAGSGNSVSGSAPGRDPALVAASPYEMPQGYVMATAPLPAGAQLVAFDRAAWLTACRERLSGYAPQDRSAALAALGGAAMGYREGYDGCETYLDSYLANVSSGTMAPQATAPGQAYMLVPVTVIVVADHPPQN